MTVVVAGVYELPTLYLWTVCLIRLPAAQETQLMPSCPNIPHADKWCKWVNFCIVTVWYGHNNSARFQGVRTFIWVKLSEGVACKTDWPTVSHWIHSLPAPVVLHGSAWNAARGLITTMSSGILPCLPFSTCSRLLVPDVQRVQMVWFQRAGSCCTVTALMPTQGMWVRVDVAARRCIQAPGLSDIDQSPESSKLHTRNNGVSSAGYC